MKLMQIIQNILILVAMPMFLFGVCGIVENVADGNLVPTLIGVALFIGSFIFFGLGLLLNKTVEILTPTTMGSVRQRLHRKIYDLLVHKGYDSSVAYDIATKFFPLV